MRVGIYLRVSTEEQRERQSIETQRDFGERYCQLHQMPISEFYVDDGISGTVPLENRPGGKRILEDARTGKFDQLLVFRLDRLGRETRLILNAVAELEKFGIRVRSMTEEFDTATSTGRLMLTMLSGFAAHERDAIRERSGSDPSLARIEWRRLGPGSAESSRTDTARWGKRPPRAWSSRMKRCPDSFCRKPM